jgi:hypothetical protein
VIRAAVIVTLAVCALSACADDTPHVVVREVDGADVVDTALPDSGRFALTYRHSVYRAPAEERFRADGDDFLLEAVVSPSEAVLDYYAIEGRRTRRNGRWVLTLAHPARFHDMALAATAVGRRTLAVDGRTYPLWTDGPARHMRVGVRG